MKTVIATLALGTLVFSASTVLADRGKLDTNADGVLSLEELQVARPGLTQERFAEFDTNGDGFLGEGERPGGRKFKRNMDTNGDGSIDLVELQAVKPGVTAEKFAELDTNNDGFGNICDPDLDNNGVVNFLDYSALTMLFNTLSDGDPDFNGDGRINFIDIAIGYPAYFNLPPGPSGVAP